MAFVSQTKEELERHLRDSVGFLASSSAAFDSGFLGEAKRLATTIRVLVHDTASSTSLLHQLGLKNLAFVTTANRFNPQNLLPHSGLVGFRMQLSPDAASQSSYFAPLGDGPPARNRPRVSFVDWWGEIVIRDKSGAIFTRKDLVLALSNKDGGAHVDPNLDISYAALTRGNSMGWVASSSSGTQPLMDVELHSVRQVAYELLQTLREGGVVAP